VVTRREIKAAEKRLDHLMRCEGHVYERLTDLHDTLAYLLAMSRGSQARHDVGDRRHRRPALFREGSAGSKPQP
jgi:hypothetical protein